MTVECRYCLNPATGDGWCDLDDPAHQHARELVATRKVEDLPLSNTSGWHLIQQLPGGWANPAMNPSRYVRKEDPR